MKPLCRHLVLPVFKILFGLSLLHAGAASAFTIIELPEVPIPGVGESVDPDQIEEVLPGNIVTDSSTLNTQIQPVTNALGAHIQGVQRVFAMPTRGDGAAAGDSSFQSLWANSSYTSFENNFSRTAYDGTLQLLLAGFDFVISGNHLLGLALSSEKSDIDTAFNDGNQEIEGTTIAPYYGWSISDHWSLDLSFGMSELDIDQFRIPLLEDTFVIPGPVVSAGDIVVELPTPIRSSTSSERDFYMLNVNGFWSVDNWSFGARAGYISTESEVDAYSESGNGAIPGPIPASSVELEQISLGVDMACGSPVSQGFLALTMINESLSDKLEFPTGEQPSDDEDSLLIAAGWRYYGEDGVSALVELNTREGKDDYSENAVSFTLRYDFD